MHLNELKRRYRALHEWIETPQGRQVILNLMRHLSKLQHIWPKSACVLQIGTHHPFIRCHTKKQFIVSPCLDQTNQVSLLASPLRMPFDRASFDIVIAPLLFEMMSRDVVNPNEPIDELDRLLKSTGYLIIFGINPFSLWGLLLNHSHHRLAQANFKTYSSFKAKRAWLNRGYTQYHFETFHYIPPFEQEAWIQRSLFLNEMGKLVSPGPAGFYVLVMKKYEPSTNKRFVLSPSGVLF